MTSPTQLLLSAPALTEPAVSSLTSSSELSALLLLAVRLLFGYLAGLLCFSLGGLPNLFFRNFLCFLSSALPPLSSSSPPPLTLLLDDIVAGDDIPFVLLLLILNAFNFLNLWRALTADDGEEESCVDAEGEPGPVGGAGGAAESSILRSKLAPVELLS